MNTGLSLFSFLILFIFILILCVCMYIYVYVYFVFINFTNLKLGGVIFRLLIEIIILLFTTHTPHQIV